MIGINPIYLAENSFICLCMVIWNQWCPSRIYSWTFAISVICHDLPNISKTLTFLLFADNTITCIVHLRIFMILNQS